MSFNIELDEDTKKEVITKAKDQLLVEVMKEFNSKQIAAEIRNAVIKQATKTLSDGFMDSFKNSNVVERAIDSAEARVQSKIEKTLAAGLIIKFKGETEL